MNKQLWKERGYTPYIIEIKEVIKQNENRINKLKNKRFKIQNINNDKILRYANKLLKQIDLLEEQNKDMIHRINTIYNSAAF